MPAHDSFTGPPVSATGPSNYFAEVTPDDDNDLAEVTRGVYVGGSGDLAVVSNGGSEATFAAVPAGTVLPIRVRRILATGTTATNIIALS